MSAQTKNTFIKGAVILTAANFIVKLLGALYKIPLTNIIGEEGMGYYNSALTIYTTLYTVATAGLPITVSRMIASATAVGRNKEPSKILKISLLCYSGVSFLIAIFVLLFSRQIAVFVGNEKAALSLFSVAPAVFFVSTVAALRGYFQGFQNMKPTAISNIIESAVNLTVGFAASYYLIANGYSLEIVAAGAVTGVSVSSVFALLYMIIKFLSSRKKKTVEDVENPLPERNRRAILKEFLTSSAPILLGSLMMNITNSIDLLVIMNRLTDIGNTEAIANKIYGSYSSMAVLLFNMPTMIIVSLCTSMLPVIASSYTLSDKPLMARTMNNAYKICSILSMPLALGMSVMANPILLLLFSSRPEGVAIASPLLNILGLAVFPLSMATITQSMLQAIKKPSIPVRNVLIAGIIKFITNYILIGIPSIGIFGAPISTNICYIIIMVLNILSLKKHSGYCANFKDIYIKPFIASLGCVASAFLLNKLFYLFIDVKFSVIISIAFSMVIYLILLIILKIITKKELFSLPIIKKFAKKS